MSRSIRTLAGLLLGLALAAPLLPSQGFVVRDRILRRVRLLPAASGTGRFRVEAVVDVVTNAGVPGADHSYRLQARAKPLAGGLTPVGDVMVGLLVTTDPACTQAANPANGCSGGTCPAVSAGGQSVTGVCQPYDLDAAGNGYPITVCACYYRGIVTTVADEVEAKPGDAIEVQLTPAPGALPDTAPHGGNETLEIVVGSRADRPPFHAPARRRTPVGGQRNGTAFLDEVGLVVQGRGPYEAWGQPGTPVVHTHGAAAAGLPVTLVAGSPETRAFSGPFFSIDVSLPAGVVYDGIGGHHPWAVTGPGGALSIPWVVTAGLGASLQGVGLDPSGPFGLAFTGRVDLESQAVGTLGAPAIPPLGGGNPFPGFRSGVIVPNHGPVASGIGVDDGTLHSLVGQDFDATDPAATTVSVGGIPADVRVVRPNEILFRLLPAHEAVIGGPVQVVSSGGASSSHPDQMESWVFATPPATLVRREPDQAATPLASGGFLPGGGLQAGTGQLDAGTFDKWGLLMLAPGTVVRAALCEVDPGTGQLVTRCSSLSPGPLCFDPAVEPRTQMPAGPHPNADVRLQHMTDTGAVGTILRTQDDGGPGTAAFAGPPNPGAATVPADDDAPFQAAGAIDALRLGHDPAAPGATAPVRYLLLVSF